ncbi:MAG: hypothetical protein Q8P19_02710 [bacterium]|nr:hypothetical protein [bacterium]
MRTNTSYLVISAVTALAVAGMSLGALSFAQTVTPLTCSAAVSTVNTNQAAIMTAAGGNGTYAWSGTNLSITNAVGTQFAVSYPNPGVYTVTVTSAGLTANCSFTVVAATTGALACSPAAQNVTLGQTAFFTATGGNGTYAWSSPDLTITNAGGSGFSASYASTGLKTLTVTSAGVTDTCAVNVLPSGAVIVTPPVTPGLPNTGGGFGQ